MKIELFKVGNLVERPEIVQEGTVKSMSNQRYFRCTATSQFLGMYKKNSYHKTTYNPTFILGEERYKY
jgi:hypothetical protein